ncbi:hypothetical protein D9M68_1010810 [compost metagenome]
MTASLMRAASMAAFNASRVVLLWILRMGLDMGDGRVRNRGVAAPDGFRRW